MSQRCHCTNFSFDQARKVSAPADWQAKEAWYCNRCEAIRHAVQEVHQVIRGPRNATALLNATGRTTGIHRITWATPSGKIQTIEYFPYPRKVAMSDHEPYLFQLWELLQSKIEVVMTGEPDAWDPNQVIQHQGWMAAKAQARALSEALAILMKPFANDADDVARHAVAYYKDNTYEVPGLGLHLWNHLVMPDGSPRVATAPAKRERTAIKAPSKKLSDADVAFARDSISAGMLTVEDIAGMYKISPEEVKSAIA